MRYLDLTETTPHMLAFVSKDRNAPNLFLLLKSRIFLHATVTQYGPSSANEMIMTTIIWHLLVSRRVDSLFLL
jgi:hypothetical protein